MKFRPQYSYEANAQIRILTRQTAIPDLHAPGYRYFTKLQLFHVFSSRFLRYHIYGHGRQHPGNAKDNHEYPRFTM